MRKAIPYLLFSVFACLFTTGCGRLWSVKDEKSIDPEDFGQIEEITDYLTLALVRDSPAIAAPYCDTALARRIKILDTLERTAYLARKRYPAYDQFLLHNYVLAGDPWLRSKRDVYDYYITPALGDAFLYVTPMRSFIDGMEWLMVCKLVKRHGTWKLTNVKLGLNKFHGKTAADYLHRCKESMHDKDYVDAAVSMALANTLLMGGKDMRVRNAAEYTAAGNALDSAVKATNLFPLRLKALPGIKIWGIHIRFADGRLYPQLSYQTTLPMIDSLNIRQEGKGIAKAVHNFYPILAEINEKTIYVACDSTPTYPMVSKYVYVGESE